MSGRGLFDEHRYSTKGWQVRAQNSMDQASFLSHQNNFMSAITHKYTWHVIKINYIRWKYVHERHDFTVSKMERIASIAPCSPGWSWRLELEWYERKILLGWLELELVAGVVWEEITVALEARRPAQHSVQLFWREVRDSMSWRPSS